MTGHINRLTAGVLSFHITRVLFVTIFLTLIFLLNACEQRPARENKINPDTVGLIQLPAPKPIRTAEFNRIKNACQQWYDSVFPPGTFNGSMLVAKSGNIIFEKYNGSGHIGQADSLNSNSANHIASITKTFTAMAVLKLVQDTLLQLDEEFSKYFPGFNYPGVTVRNMLNHRSGLPNYLYFMDELGWDKKVFLKNQDMFDWMIKRKSQIKDISTPDTRFHYCNTNYALLALLIEKVTAGSYSSYLQKTFFTPLQMANTFVFTPTDSIRANPSYDWKGAIIPLNFLDGVYGDKNIYATPRDLLKWDRALHTNLLFNRHTLEAAYAPYSNEKPGIRNYGLGWRMNVYPDGKKIIFHNGWWHGSNAVFIRMPEDDATIIVIGNKFSRGIYKAKHLVHLFNPAFENTVVEE